MRFVLTALLLAGCAHRAPRQVRLVPGDGVGFDKDQDLICSYRAADAALQCMDWDEAVVRARAKEDRR